ncbi:SepM family pheromone-processing serine protease [Sporosarcina sp. YIM B06819]|uniref:SepM family pheromone-processing serine protease n=1 Tax=Sporosarcina sp. YIM B06819 TaxID=3081769 RepID=UPI00298C9B68|nr:SepM family pheromone-processing serine protease [Sporosarcina sp. YIM B06819]
MRKKRLGLIGVVLVILAIILVYPLDTYVSQPGGAYSLEPLVEVENGDRDDRGTFSLLTISVAKATPFSYTWAKFSDKKKILPANKVRRDGEDDKEYNIRQKKMMTGSQYNAITVAFNKAGLPVDVKFDGIFVMLVVEGGASQGILEAGDKIRAIDGVHLEQSGQFYSLIGAKKLGDEVQLSVERDDKLRDVTIVLKEIPDSEGRVGLGVQFQEDLELTTDPKVDFQTSNIGGPSAGLMFTLEIMNQLLDEDLTKGYNIAGTGEMLEDGTVGRIGGADFKVIAADRKDVEIFFAPADDLPEEVKAANPGILTNYEEAVKMAEKIGTKMKIVPVKTIDDALDYLASLEEK